MGYDAMRCDAIRCDAMPRLCSRRRAGARPIEQISRQKPQRVASYNMYLVGSVRWGKALGSSKAELGGGAEPTRCSTKSDTDSPALPKTSPRPLPRLIPN